MNNSIVILIITFFVFFPHKTFSVCTNNVGGWLFVFLHKIKLDNYIFYDFHRFIFMTQHCTQICFWVAITADAACIWPSWGSCSVSSILRLDKAAKLDIHRFVMKLLQAKYNAFCILLKPDPTCSCVTTLVAFLSTVLGVGNVHWSAAITKGL